MQLVVARVGRVHGLRGEVTVQVHTDAPQDRFLVGARFATLPPGAGPLTLRSARVHSGVQLLAFQGVTDRSQAEALRGVQLLVDDDAAQPAEPGAAGPADRASGGEPRQPADHVEQGWYEHQLVGLRAELPGGQVIGEVVGLEPRAAQDLLVVRLADGAQALVPFVHALVPEVDLSAGRVVLDPPAGLLDLGREG